MFLADPSDGIEPQSFRLVSFRKPSVLGDDILRSQREDIRHISCLCSGCLDGIPHLFPVGKPLKDIFFTQFFSPDAVDLVLPILHQCLLQAGDPSKSGSRKG